MQVKQATRRATTWLLGLLPLAAAALLAQICAATAHASLTGSEPADGAVLATAPPAYSLKFSEPVSPLSLRLVGPDGTSVPLDRFELSDRTLSIEAPPALGRGTHVLSWRVVSEDGHPVGGSVVFSIGAASAEAPLVEDEIDRTVRGGLWLAKVALYVGLFIGVGGAFARAVLLPRLQAGKGIIVAALALGAAGALVSLGFQGLDALGAAAGRFFQPVIWSTALSTSYGRTVLAALAAFVLASAAVVTRQLPARTAAVLALGFAAAAPALSGHAGTAQPQWLMRTAVFAHVAAIAIWAGALPPLGLALRRGEAGALSGLSRFSRIVPSVVVLLVAAGVALALVQVGRPSALEDTAYGRVLSIKLALLVPLFALAAINRWGLTAEVEAGSTGAARRLVRSIVVESLLVVAILGAAAAWRFTPPPRVLDAAAAEPAVAVIQTDRAQAHVQVMPGRAGPVAVSVNLLDQDFQRFAASEVTVVFSNPNAGIEPFKRRLTLRPEGNWHADGMTVPLPGLWRVRVDVLIGDFEMVRLEGELRIRP